MTRAGTALVPKIIRRVKPWHDYLLRQGAWTVLLPLQSREGRYVSQYVATHEQAIQAVDDYYRYRGTLTVPEAPDAAEIVSRRGISLLDIP